MTKSFRYRAVAPAALALILSVAVRADKADKTGKGDLDTRPTFSAAKFVEHVRFLASDELEGRGTGTAGLKRAAEYVVKRLKEAGCVGAGDDGSFYNYFEVSAGRDVDEEKATLTVSGVSAAWAVKKDWIPFAFSKNEEADGPLAFAGYGIDAPEHEYNDYEGFDAKGKVLLIFRDEPRDEDEEAVFGGKTQSAYGQFAKKARTAAEHGAKALLLVDPPARESSGLYPFRSRRRRQQVYQLPMAHVTREVAAALLEQAGMPSLEELEKRLEARKGPASADMKGVTVSLTPAIYQKKLMTRNVVAMLPGDGSTDEIVIVGAHYDHLGKRRPWMRRGSGGSEPQIHNGADDNASGTAGVIELAAALAKGRKLRRNVVFMTYSAEERGLLGSKHFVAHPTFDLSRVKAMLNMDMIGRLAQDKLEIYGTDTGAGLAELVQRAAGSVGLDYKLPESPRGVFRQSDHYSFYRKDIPVLFPFTGMHKQYHQPEDDWELIDAQGATRMLEFVWIVVSELANAENGPEFLPPQVKKPAEQDAADTPATPDANKPAATQAEADKPAEDGDTPRMPRVRMGIMPGYGDESGKGLLVEGVMEGGAAQKAGIKDNDRIIKIGKHEVADIYGYMNAVRNFNPGDKAQVVIMRDGKEQVVTITFDAAPPPQRDDG